MKNNYPIKYAIKPIYEHSGYAIGTNNLISSYDVLLYIVSKCYLIEESVIYDENGERKNKYKVVYPYEKIDQTYNFKRCEPEFNFYGQSTNCDILDKVFDDYDSCYAETEKLNEEKLNKKVVNLPFNDKFMENVKKTEDEFNEKVMEYRKIERKLEDSTSDLVVGYNPKMQNIIVCTKDKEFLSTISLYRYIKLCDSDNYCVYTVNSQEFEYLTKQIEEEKNIDFNSTNLLLYHKKDSEIVLITDCKREENTGSYYLKNECMYYDKDMIPFHLDKSINVDESFNIIYTMENYEDIIKSFIPNFSECYNSEIKIGNKVLSKTIRLR